MLDQRGKFWKTIWRYKIQSKQKMFHYIWAKWCLASVCSALHNTLQTWESSQSLGAKFSSFIPNLNEADVLFTQSSFINFIEPQSGESLLYSSENTSMCVFLTDVARDQVLRYQHKKNHKWSPSTSSVWRHRAPSEELMCGFVVEVNRKAKNPRSVSLQDGDTLLCVYMQ